MRNIFSDFCSLWTPSAGKLKYIRSNAAFSNWVPLHRRSPKSSSVCVVHFIFEDVKWSIFSLARIHSIFVDLNKKEYLFCLLGFENTGRMYQKNMTCFHHTCCRLFRPNFKDGLLWKFLDCSKSKSNGCKFVPHYETKFTKLE